MYGRLRFALIALVFVAFTGASTAAALRWDDSRPLAAGEVWLLGPEGPRRDTVEAAKQARLLVVDLSDGWAPFLFSDSDGAGTPSKPNPYRSTFVALANDSVTQDELFLRSPAGRGAVLSSVPAALRSSDPTQLSPDEQRALDRAWAELQRERAHGFLEVYGIPPTLSVLARRVERDSGKACYDAVDVEALRAAQFEISFQGQEQARTEYSQAVDDATRVAERLGALGEDAAHLTPEETAAKLAAVDPTLLERYRVGQARLRAVRAVQDRLVCEELLAPERFTPGAFDLATHRALAEFERKNDIFGWGFVSGETREALQQPPGMLHFETLKRILAERVADAAGILEDGSAGKGGDNPTYVDEAGVRHLVPNLIADFVTTLLAAMGVATPQDLEAFLRAQSAEAFATLRVAYEPPPLPPYYAAVMDLSAEIDRGDVWYDAPFGAGGQPLTQRRLRYPTFTLYATWREQRIPLVRWRTTIGSWRSELGADGHTYLKYKNSDVGPRVWKNIVAAPAWLPPDRTPGKDLLTKKVLDRKQGPVTVVNTEVMGPGFASAYGLAMAIHLRQLPDGGLFDNQIRTHGSVDYTSIARRFSHGCHRLVNNRAVRLFDFVLRHRKYARLGDHRLGGHKRKFSYQGHRYEYSLTTRGYYYDLRPPVPITVLEGRVLGAAREPIHQVVRKPGVDYGPPPVDNPVETQPVVGP
ncbi:MAG: L,D-transpeptidase [Candidatus Binatia bacterium]